MKNSTTIAFACVALLLALSGCTGASGGVSSSRFDSIWTGWGWSGLAGIAFVLMGAVLALGYMAATLLNDEAMRAWVRKEAAQVFYSGLILIFTIALIGSLDYWLKTVSLVGAPAWQGYVNNAVCCTPGTGCLSLIGKNRPCHIALSLDYLQMMYETAKLNSISALMHYWFYAFFANLHVNASLDLLVWKPGFSFAPFAFLSMNSDYYMIIFDMTAKTMIFTRAQQYFIDMFQYAFFPVLLSMGLILRILHFTRKLGGLLVALSLAFYIVLPMFYVLSSAIMFGFMGGWTTAGPQPFGNTFDQSTTTLPMQPNPVDFADKQSAFSSRIDAMNVCGPSDPSYAQQQDNAIADLQGKWGMISGTGWRDKFSSQGDYFAPDGPAGVLGFLMVFTLVIPFLALMTSLAAFKVLSPIIGGDVEISILSRLI